METIPYAYILEAKFCVLFFLAFKSHDIIDKLEFEKKGPAAKQIIYECLPIVWFLIFMAICFNPVLIMFANSAKDNSGWATAIIFFDLFTIFQAFGAITSLPSIKIDEKHLS